MSVDLVKMCRRLSIYAHAQLSSADLERIADRIEELERVLGLADDQCREWRHHCKAAEANLAKAVEALGRIKRGDFSIMTPPAYVTNPLPSAQEIARTTLAELKGQNDE